MKKISLYLGVAIMLIMSSCADFVEPAIPYNGFDTGVYLRTTERRAVNINFFDMANAKFEIVVEAVADNNGEGVVGNVEVFVRRRRVQALTPYVKVTEIPGSAFGAYPGTRNFPLAPNRTYPAALISIPLSQSLQAMSLTTADINGGDFIEYRLVLNTSDGRVFSDNNLSTDIATGSFYDSPFFYRASVVCPSALSGTYDFETRSVVGGSGADVANCGDVKTGEVTLTAVSAGATSYTISDSSFGIFDCAYGDSPPGGTVRFNDACGGISMSGTDKYGDGYSLQYIEHDATRLTFSWVNTWGDGGTTTLIRRSGTWPAGLR